MALTLLGSVLLSPAANVTIVFLTCVGILFMGAYLNKVAGRMSEPASTMLSALYFTIPHLEFFDIRRLIIHDWPLVAWVDVGLATLYGFLYSAFLLLAACLVFRRKPLS